MKQVCDSQMIFLDRPPVDLTGENLSAVCELIDEEIERLLRRGVEEKWTVLLAANRVCALIVPPMSGGELLRWLRQLQNKEVGEMFKVSLDGLESVSADDFPLMLREAKGSPFYDALRDVVFTLPLNGDGRRFLFESKKQATNTASALQAMNSTNKCKVSKKLPQGQVVTTRVRKNGKHSGHWLYFAKRSR